MNERSKRNALKCVSPQRRWNSSVRLPLSATEECTTTERGGEGFVIIQNIINNRFVLNIKLQYYLFYCMCNYLRI